MAGRFRNRVKLADIKAQASGMMFDAQELVEMVKALVEDAADGIDVALVREPGAGTVMDFLTGKTDRLPFKIEIKL